MFENTNFRNLVAVREGQNKEMQRLAASERLYRSSLPPRDSWLAKLGQQATVLMGHLQERYSFKILTSH
jgi:hypothetical protein